MKPLSLDVSPTRWQFTSAFLSLWGKADDAKAKQQPTLAWAYGASMDRQEQGIIMLVEHRLLTRTCPF